MISPGLFFTLTKCTLSAPGKVGNITVIYLYFSTQLLGNNHPRGSPRLKLKVIVDRIVNFAPDLFARQFDFDVRYARSDSSLATSVATSASDARSDISARAVGDNIRLPFRGVASDLFARDIRSPYGLRCHERLFRSRQLSIIPLSPL